MENILADLWNGNISPSERCGAHDPELKDLSRRVQENREELCEALTVQQRGVFDKYIDCSEEYTFQLMQEAFSDGFSLAVKLLMHAMV
ncbi:MAG: DUF6809 family protein [Faecousia sp.]